MFPPDKVLVISKNQNKYLESTHIQKVRLGYWGFSLILAVFWKEKRKELWDSEKGGKGIGGGLTIRYKAKKKENFYQQSGRKKRQFLGRGGGSGGGRSRTKKGDRRVFSEGSCRGRGMVRNLVMRGSYDREE